MGFFKNLFTNNDSGNLIGHIVAFSSLVLATDQGQALLANVLQHKWGWLVPLITAYLGGARANQPKA